MNRLLRMMAWLLPAAGLMAGEPTAPPSAGAPAGSAPVSKTAATATNQAGPTAAPAETSPSTAATNSPPAATNAAPTAPAVSASETNAPPTNEVGTASKPATSARETGDESGERTDSRRSRSEADPRSFERFRLLTQRNIFDPTRRRREPGRIERPVTPPSPPREEILTLTGAIVYDDKAFAMINSTDSRYRGVFSPGDALAEWRVAAIDSKGILLTNEEQQLRLPVGQSLRRRGDQPWELARDTRVTAAASRSGSPASAASGSSSGTTAASSPKPDTGEMSELMRRLMERRRQQLNQ